MPATNPRLQVIVPREVMEPIARLAKLQGRSRSAVARDFLTQVAPILARVAATLEAAVALDQEGRAKLLTKMEALQAAAEGQAAQLTLGLERAVVTATVGRRTERRRRRRPSAPHRKRQ